MERGYGTTIGLNPKRKGSGVEEALGLLGCVNPLKDDSLDGGTVGDGLFRVDRLVGLLSVEKVGDELGNTGNTG